MGEINGMVNSVETRSAIKDMNIAYKINNDASLKTKEKDTLILLGTLFYFDKYLVADKKNKRTKRKKIQAALKVYGYYHGKIDGAIGKVTRSSITQYKVNKGLSQSSSLDFEEEYQLISGAKEENDKDIEDAIVLLKSLGISKQEIQVKKPVLQTLSPTINIETKPQSVELKDDETILKGRWE